MQLGCKQKSVTFAFYWNKISSQPSEGTKNQPDALTHPELIAF